MKKKTLFTIAILVILIGGVVFGIKKLFIDKKNNFVTNSVTTEGNELYANAECTYSMNSEYLYYAVNGGYSYNSKSVKRSSYYNENGSHYIKLSVGGKELKYLWRFRTNYTSKFTSSNCYNVTDYHRIYCLGSSCTKYVVASQEYDNNTRKTSSAVYTVFNSSGEKVYDIPTTRAVNDVLYVANELITISSNNRYIYTSSKYSLLDYPEYPVRHFIDNVFIDSNAIYYLALSQTNSNKVDVHKVTFSGDVPTDVICASIYGYLSY